ncbi:uncharacterized protein [Linepithema humile]|uniref:uncharacterized protein n=1 Tax=Linepithema humile TaxID=83485 RepID=UPI00351F7E26
MSTTQQIDQTNIICGLKAAVTALECHHDAQRLKEQKKKIKCKAKPAYIYTHIIVPDKSCAEKKKLRSKPSDTCTTALKDVPRHLTEIQSKDKKRIDKCEKTSRRLIFPEMRAGILHTRCYCLHRNGLQDDCPLSQCQGRLECLIKPWPICPPAKFIRQRYPELFPKTSNINCVI